MNTENSDENPKSSPAPRRPAPQLPPDGSLQSRGPGYFVSALFLLIGLAFLFVIPSPPDRRTLMIVVGIANILWGLIKLNRTIGPPRA
jgi:hypothetical protein